MLDSGRTECVSDIVNEDPTYLVSVCLSLAGVRVAKEDYAVLNLIWFSQFKPHPRKMFSANIKLWSIRNVVAL